MQHPLPTPASILPIVRSTLREVTRLLPVMRVIHMIIRHQEDLCLLRETTAIIRRRRSVEAMWTITECAGLLHLPVTSLVLATTALRIQLHILVAIHPRRLGIMTDMTGGPLLPMIDMVVILPLPPL